MLVDNPAGLLESSGLRFEINRTILHPYGLALAGDTDTPDRLILLQTDDPEGYVFGRNELLAGKAKLKQFRWERFGQLYMRHSSLGYTVQRLP